MTSNDTFSRESQSVITAGIYNNLGPKVVFAPRKSRLPWAMNYSDDLMMAISSIKFAS